jgi:hypothetical protein
LVYGFLTTAPNAVVEPIHPKAMPVILTTDEERDVWMRAMGRSSKGGIPDGDYIAAAMNSGKFNLIDSPVDLANPDPKKGLGVDVLLDQLAHKPYAAVFLDTWARMLWASGGHDSDQNTVGPAVQGCDRIRKALGCTVVMVAHIGVSTHPVSSSSARDLSSRWKAQSNQ